MKSVWVERFAEVMRRDKRLEVTTSADLAQLLGVERQKQLLGCGSDTENCMAELASVWWSASGRMTGEPALLDWLDEQAQAVTRTIFPPAPLAVGPLVVGGAGVIALGVGVTMLVLSNTVSLQAARSAADVPTLSLAIENGRTQGTVGVVALSVGGAALATAIIWAAVRTEPATAVSLVPVPGGMAATVGGRW